MDINESLKIIQSQITDLDKKIGLQPLSNPVSNKWAPEKQVRVFLDYEPTQMAAFLKSDGLIISQIGRRKFILRESLENLLQKNILTKK